MSAPEIPERVFVCGNPEQFGDGSATYVIEERRPTFWVEGELPNIPNAKLWSVIQQALDTWGQHFDIIGSPAKSKAKANLLVQCVRMDGQGKVLGDCVMPRPGLFQQRMRLDTSERFVLAVNAPRGSVDLQATVNHEVGHFLGYPHWPVGAPPELMEPAIQQGLRDPQPTEIAWGVKIFGPPKTATPQPTGPGVTRCTLQLEPGTDKVTCKINIEAEGRKAELAGSQEWS